jgi:hypothetical protein
MKGDARSVVPAVTWTFQGGLPPAKDVVKCPHFIKNENYGNFELDTQS